MGKRKTKRKVKPKKKQVLDTQFDCIACHHEKSIEVKMQRDAKVGNLNCRICGIKFQSPINPLSDPVDVYYEWVDASQTAKPEDSRGISDDELDEDSRLRGRGDFGDDDEDY